MSISPDQSRFTACVIGEATPAEQSSFDAALLKDAALRAEAVTLSRTAHRLATALKKEEPFGLTPAQRQAIFQHGASQTPQAPQKVRRPAWVGPSLATAGIAAALLLTFQALPAFRSTPPAPAGVPGIPTVAIRPESPAKSGSHPVVLPPSLAKGTSPGVMPDTATPAAPITGGPPPMTAIPPVITVVPAPAMREPARDLTPPGEPLPGRRAPDESLANPGPRRP